MNEAEEKIMSSLECGKMLGSGQSLVVLTKVAFGEYNFENKEKTQRILYKMKKEYRATYFRETKVWAIWD